MIRNEKPPSSGTKYSNPHDNEEFTPNFFVHCGLLHNNVQCLSFAFILVGKKESIFGNAVVLIEETKGKATRDKIDWRS
jgi:hypothetical protein